MKKVVWIAAASLVCLTAGSARADGPTPTGVYIEGVNYAGTGCPAGSVAENLSTDAQALTLLFSDYVASAGGGAPATSMVQCDVDVALHLPPGWSYSLFSVDFRGYGQLDQGASGVETASYSFAGLSGFASLGQFEIDGPYDNDYKVRNIVPVDSMSWSPCDGTTRALHIASNVQANGSPQARALMTVDSIDGEVAHQYGIRWRQCPVDPVDGFIGRLYGDVLGRGASPAEIASWAAQVRAGKPRVQVAQAFLLSPEGRTAEVLANYRALLNRDGAASELSTWAQWLQAGHGLDALEVALVGTPEFYQKAGSTAVGFVYSSFQHLLGRAPNPGAPQYWLDYIQKHGRDAMTVAVLTTPESRRRMVAGWYAHLLRRAASPAEQNAWAGKMQGKLAQETVEAALLGSDEYFNLK